MEKLLVNVKEEISGIFGERMVGVVISKLTDFLTIDSKNFSISIEPSFDFLIEKDLKFRTGLYFNVNFETGEYTYTTLTDAYDPYIEDIVKVLAKYKDQIGIKMMFD